MHVDQPREAIGSIGIHVATMSETGPGVPRNAAPLMLAALHTVTTLTGSALLALALAKGFLGADAVWAAAHVDEDWNAEQWGEDAEAQARRAYREQEFRAAALVLGAEAL
jgi:chaperone required for assembly of F1-ATPase